MNENNVKESKAIKVLFQKLLNENYEQKEYREVYTIDILPRTVNNLNKYTDFEKSILNNNSYNILNKFVLALSKLYLYDNKIFKLSHDEEESLSFEEYHNDINRFIDDCMYNLSIPTKIMDFGCTELRFVMDIFKSEGLFIRRPYF